MTKLLSDPERLLALETCEKKIYTAFRRGLEATRVIGTELLKIQTQELFRSRDYETWNAYVEKELRRDLRTVNRMIEVAETIGRLEDAKLAVPDNESQIIELARLKPEVQPVVWQRILEVSEERDWPVTVSMVRTAVDKQTARMAEKDGQSATATAPAKRGLEPTLEINEEAPLEQRRQQHLVEQQISLTEEGERALDRIGRLCGEPVKDAIRHLRVQLSERDIRRWAEQDDYLCRNLSYYVIGLRWTVGKAIAYDEATVDGGTTVERLVTFARARGGLVSVQHDDAKITVEIIRSN